MSHLGRWLTALVDGELDWVERDRVLNHLARCEGCRREANALRALKRRMTALGDTSADDVTSRLLDLPRSPGMAGDDLADIDAAWPHWSAPPGRWTRWPARRAHRGWRAHRRWKVATGSAAALLATVGAAAFLLGGSAPGRPLPQVTPSVDTFWLQHSYDVGQVPAANLEPAAPSAPTGRGPAGRAPGTTVPVVTQGSSATPAATPVATASAQPVPGKTGAANRSG